MDSEFLNKTSPEMRGYMRYARNWVKQSMLSIRVTFF